MRICFRSLAVALAMVVMALGVLVPAEVRAQAVEPSPALDAPSDTEPAPGPSDTAIPPAPDFGLPAEDGSDAEFAESEAALEAELEEAGAAEVDIDFAEVLGYGGIVGYSIVALSVVALALAGLFFFELRAGSLMPSGVYQSIRNELEDAGASAALSRSQQEPSFLGHVLSAGLDALRDGRAEARAVMADAADTWIAGTVRRIEYLNLIATISPMLGLLGTVVGMVKTFAALAQSTGPVDPVELSAGIFQALVTTMMGLAVAIPTLLLYTVLRNRADHIQSTVVSAGEQLVAGLADTEAGAPRATSAAAS